MEIERERVFPGQYHGRLHNPVLSLLFCASPSTQALGSCSQMYHWPLKQVFLWWPMESSMLELRSLWCHCKAWSQEFGDYLGRRNMTREYVKRHNKNNHKWGKYEHQREGVGNTGEGVWCGKIEERTTGEAYTAFHLHLWPLCSSQYWILSNHVILSDEIVRNTSQEIQCLPHSVGVHKPCGWGQGLCVILRWG